jgi:hypothetical protein
MFLIINDCLLQTLKKFKQAVQNSEVDRQLSILQAQELANVEAERDRLKLNVEELTAKLGAMIAKEENSVSAVEVKKLTAKVRQLESERDLEVSAKNRIQVGVIDRNTQNGNSLLDTWPFDSILQARSHLGNQSAIKGNQVVETSVCGFC